MGGGGREGEGVGGRQRAWAPPCVLSWIHGRERAGVLRAAVMLVNYVSIGRWCTDPQLTVHSVFIRNRGSCTNEIAAELRSLASFSLNRPKSCKGQRF